MAPVIGVFDSGFGGLTVLRELRNSLPLADYLYFGDTAHLPYGAKSVRTVAKYATSAAHFLEARGIEILVVACNTATALAFDEIRSAVKVPVVGVIEPGAERALAISKTKKLRSWPPKPRSPATPTNWRSSAWDCRLRKRPAHYLCLW